MDNDAFPCETCGKETVSGSLNNGVCFHCAAPAIIDLIDADTDTALLAVLRDTAAYGRDELGMLLSEFCRRGDQSAAYLLRGVLRAKGLTAAPCLARQTSLNDAIAAGKLDDAAEVERDWVENAAAF